MAFCPNCGIEVAGGQRFCAKCGAAQPPGYGDQNMPKSRQGFGQGRDISDNKVFAIISYIGFLSLVSYFAAPKTSRYARFHAIQGLNLFILECIVSAAGGILSGVFFWAWPVRTIISASTGLVGLGFLALSIIGIVKASNGEMEELPVVGQMKIVKN